MLYLICSPEAQSLSFDSALSARGVQQAALLKDWFLQNGVFVLYLAANRRAFETGKPFVLFRRQTGQYVRPEVRFELCDRVILPEQQPHALDVDYVRSFGIPPQNILGAMAGPEPTEADFQRRVVEWFTNDFMEKYRDAPNPTAIIADSTVLKPIIQFLTRRGARPVLPAELLPAQAVEFKSDGLQLAFSQILMLG